MAAQSRMHEYLNWAKLRLDEMDAALASLEARASSASSESKAKVQQTLAALQKQRSEFEASMKRQIDAGQAAWDGAKAQLEAQSKAFDAGMKAYMEDLGKGLEQQQAAFREIATAQVKAWRGAAETFKGQMNTLAAERRADVDRAIERMQADAAEAERRLEKLRKAGGESWSAFTTALADSRKAFDRGNHAVAAAIKGALADRKSEPVN